MQARAALLLMVSVVGGCKHRSSAVTACPELAPPGVAAAGFSHTLNASLAGEAVHSADDAIVNPGEGANVGAKLAYGVISKDLEDEATALWVLHEDCRWSRSGDARTDDDGRVRFTIDGAALRQPGLHRYDVVVEGDGSRAVGTVYALPPKTRVVVFDVDGTLTTGDAQLADQLLGGAADMRPGADEVARLWAEAGYLPIYLTGRPYLLRSMTHRWLEEHHFPRGPLVTTDSLRAALPQRARVGRFKREVLTDLAADLGLDIAAAYGNASTDVCAYSEAKLPRAYIVGGVDRSCDGATALLELTSYVDHAAVLRAELK